MEYNGVPLASMTTKQLSELAKSKGIGPKQSRAEFLNALADALLNEGEGEFGEDEPRVVSERRVETVETKMERRRDGEERVVTTSRRIITNEFGEEEEVEVDDVGVDASERGFDAEEEETEGYFVGSAAFVWEDEVYTYGGLTHEGEFVTSVYRWSGRGACYEVPATATDKEVGVPPGRYGHTAVVHGDLLYVFGGQGQFGCLNDLWVFDFVACTWTMVDVIGDPPSSRTGHCMCISDNVLFVFGGKDVQPGQDVVIYNDLYGFDLNDSEWLTIDTQRKHPVGGDACAMAARNSVLYILSPSETSIEMVVWVLQLSAQGTPRWTMVARAGQVPTPRTSFLSCVVGANWIIHGGRVLLKDGILGDTYVFHFPTAEWARLNPDSDTDPRSSHAGACVDGALVILHGSRDRNVRGTPEETSVCIAINLEAYLPFPLGEDDVDETYTPSKHAELRESESDSEVDKGAEKAMEDEVASTVLEKGILEQLNEKGVYGTKGGTFGGSLHIPTKGSHDPGDIEFIVDDCKIFAHSDILREGSKFLNDVMDQSAVASALENPPDVVRIVRNYYPIIGFPLSLIIRALHWFAVVVLFTVRRMVAPEQDAMKKIVITDTSVPVLLAALRWIYQIPVHPSVDMLADLFQLAKRLKIDGLPSYCVNRMKKELNLQIVAGAAKVAYTSRNAPLWATAVKMGQQHWNEISHTDGFLELTHADPKIAQAFALAIHESVILPGQKGFGSLAA